LDSNEGGYKKRQDCGRVGKIGRRRVLQGEKFSGLFSGVQELSRKKTLDRSSVAVIEFLLETKENWKVVRFEGGTATVK